MAGRPEKIVFEGAHGLKLAARLDRPQGPVKAYALFAHCFTCTKDIFAASRIAGALAENGIAVLRFDFTGLGSSEGEFENTNFTSNVKDLVAAADYLRETVEAPRILIGHSLGGAAVLVAAGRIQEAVAVATIGAPSSPEHVSHLFEGGLDAIAEKGEAEVHIAGRPFRIQKHFLDDIASQNLEPAIGSLKKALLVFHSPVDQTVGIENAQAIFVAAKHPKSFISLDDADHLLSRKKDAIYVAETLSAWAMRYLDDRAAEKQASGTKAPAGTVLVTEAETGGFANVVQAGRHQLAADEPADVGGTDTGPSPYEFLLAGLGACTSMTLRMYADRKKWPLEKVTVRLRHQKVYAKDRQNCETKEGKIDEIERDIVIEGPLDAEQRKRLLEIADKCPVHRTLDSEIRIVSRLAK
ncbi:MAG: alpha/beta fold hydrolase [Alphaproteobacteria bacterium]|nr:alpha/beta fold hydrolase [Alphaproteobacteria bacterium]